ncbi:MAG: penicillin-binding protein 1A [Cytophagaceae bacterium]
MAEFKTTVINKIKSPAFKKTIAAIAIALLFIIILFFVWVFKNLPGEQELKSIKNAEASIVYSSDGVILGKYFIEDRTNIKYEQIPSHLIHALIATEDSRFYQHNGIDKIGWLRVLIKTLILQDESAGGGSTISQQLAKNLFKRREYMFLSVPVNKIREAIIATRIEDLFTKKEILTLYLNTVPFGENVFGIESGSQRYYSKPTEKLKIEEAAVLVGMLKANTYYSPRKFPDRARERRNLVLSLMAKNNFLSFEASDSLKNLPLKIDYNASGHNEGLATYFREQLRMELIELLQSHKKPNGQNYNLYTDGLKIHVTINSRMQKHAEEAVNEHMSHLQKSFNDHWKGSLWKNKNDVLKDAIKRTEKYKTLKKKGLNEKQINETFNAQTSFNTFSWEGERERKMSSLDSLKYYMSFLHTGFLVMDQHTGEIQAWVGGINHKYFKYDHVNYHAKRQVGSTFKPIVYAAALENGISPCEYFPNQLVSYTDYNNWTPKNSDNTYGGYYSMTGALTNSLNTVSAQIIMKTGLDNVIDFAEKLGIKASIDAVPSIALGSEDISLIEMVNAYATFANGGFSVEPKYLLKLEDKEGNVLFKMKKTKSSSRIMKEETAFFITEMLKNVTDNGTASRLRTIYGLQQEIAGKTGTTQSQADGWFIGYTPDLVAGCWVGADDRRIHFRSVQLGQGANMALPIFGKFLTKVNKDKKLSKFHPSAFPEIPEELASDLNCDSYKEIVEADTSEQSIFQLFKTRNKEKQPKEKESFNWFKNIFKKKR